MRSLLFVPGDSPKKQQKGLDCGADALILDLEDSVALDGKPQAREITRAFLESTRELPKRPLLIVRINALTTGMSDADLLPPVSDLPEHLPEAEFVARYGGVGGAGYQRLVATIESRLDAMPMFQ